MGLAPFHTLTLVTLPLALVTTDLQSTCRPPGRPYTLDRTSSMDPTWAGKGKGRYLSMRGSRGGRGRKVHQRIAVPLCRAPRSSLHGTCNQSRWCPKLFLGASTGSGRCLPGSRHSFPSRDAARKTRSHTRCMRSSPRWRRGGLGRIWCTRSVRQAQQRSAPRGMRHIPQHWHRNTRRRYSTPWSTSPNLG